MSGNKAIQISLLCVCLAGSVAAHVYLGLGPIKEYSATYDEPVHLAAGYIAWKAGRYDFTGYYHPPFGQLFATIPLMFMKPILPVHDPHWISRRWSPIDQARFADLFLYHNRVSPEALLEPARKMQLVLSVCFGLFLATAAFLLGGSVAAAFAIVMWAFSSFFIAHGTLVSIDLPFAFFFFGFFAALIYWRTLYGSVAAGLMIGLCLASKYFGVAVFPALGLTLAWLYFVEKKKDAPAEAIFRSVAAVVVTAIIVIAAVYRFSHLDIFWQGFSAIFSRSQSGRASFFMGEHGSEGWLAYFPMAFLLKTPLPLLALFSLSIGAAALRKIRFSAFLWIPPLVFFAITCVSKVQIGHRYILAVYPFLIILTAMTMALGRKTAMVGMVLCAWLAVDAWRARPHFLSYFNELAGGSSNGYRYFTDSNMDWGQGLKLLSRELSEEDRRNGIYLSYFGVADPHAHGIRYLDVGSDAIAGHRDNSGDPSMRPSTFVLSATNLQATYYADRQVFEWVKAYKPMKQIAHSLFLYDFKNHPEAIQRLEALRKQVP